MRSLSLLAILAALLAVLFASGMIRGPDGGRYPRYEHDHAELMVSDTPGATRTITVVFIGNSLTFHNDLPAMLVNLASSDSGNSTRLQVKGETLPGADLDELRTKTGAIAWTRAHRADYAVLQDRSRWYDFTRYDALGVARAWDEALRPQGVTPLLFQVWADGDESDIYRNPVLRTFGSNRAVETSRSASQTAVVAQALRLDVVPVGDAFLAAHEAKDAPDVLDGDHRHPSVAGTYLAALVFYRVFTGRTGAEATYRPHGVSTRDTAALVRVNSG